MEEEEKHRKRSRKYRTMRKNENFDMRCKDLNLKGRRGGNVAPQKRDAMLITSLSTEAQRTG